MGRRLVPLLDATVPLVAAGAVLASAFPDHASRPRQPARGIGAGPPAGLHRVTR